MQFHPEFKSKPLKPHPLFAGFVEASHQHKLAAPAARDRLRGRVTACSRSSLAALVDRRRPRCCSSPGPCVIESEAHAVETALARSRHRRRRAGVPYVFKASYDKANRTSRGSFRGPGLREGCASSRRVREEARRAGPDRHPRAVAGGAGRRGRRRSADSRRSSPGRPTCSSRPRATGRVVNIKKGQFLAPDDMRHAIAKVTAAGNQQRRS